jgi:adenylate kinase family enzyme
MKRKIHILGASGSGTTTIAKNICDNLGYIHFDSDNYFWLPTQHSFTVERSRNECLQMMKNDLSSCNEWILSGSLTGWGDVLVPYFDLVIFVYVPQDIRLERLKNREYERYGDNIFPGGDKYEHSKDFLEWAASYDFGTRNGRSLPKHEAWLKTIECPVIRIVNNILNETIDSVTNAILT